ncbi:MAG TPA: histidinol-phosphatase [Bacillota bacterium]|nr:histidinol-phosphatase [Bacillota bacterium]
MVATNFHTHCQFCDGKGEPREFVEEAIKRDMKAIGFSSHAPIPFPNDWTMQDAKVQLYLDTINALKREYHGKIEVYTGLEIDFFEGDRRNIFKRYKVDYQIGAVHIFPDPLGDKAFSIDGTREEFEETLNILFAGDMKSFAESYYRQLIYMLERHKPEILGHLDVIKKNNGDDERYFSEKDYWYRSAILELLDTVQAQKTIVEVNTGGMIRGFIKEPYPSPWILAECKKREIPVMISSDAHAAESIDAYFDEAVALLKEAGYTEHMVLLEGRWQAATL